MTKYSVLLLALTVAACSSGSSSGFNNTNQAKIGSNLVKWAKLDDGNPIVSSYNPEGLDALMFIFSSDQPYVSSTTSKITEADWEREAARLGSSVERVKKAILGGGSDAYKSAEGNINTCTIGAIKRGLCDRDPNVLSLEKRQEFAKAALASNGRCRWVRFDPALNSALTAGGGGADYTLYALADC